MVQLSHPYFYFSLFFWAPKSLQMVIAAMKLKDTCSLEAKFDQLRQHIKKQRHYFANKDPSSQSYGFPVVMYGCAHWTIKKTECGRIDAFELWCWRRLLRVPWTARRSKQSILKEICPGYSLEGLMLKLKLQYFGHFMWRVDSLEKSLMLGGIGGRRRRGWQDEVVGWHHRLNGHGFEQALGAGDRQGSLACCSPWGHRESDMTKRLKWTDTRDSK